ncbi:asparagine synthetase domain-containing protein [Aspergillus ibericus CBS 121593]|uniref:Asparagine synthase related protein n=1 Tax=Aspergillus ibericus CBS 121593 TaxID=1448316 RepID=A0A395H2F9_9EURO|nr:asparagine synthase related protein [Aspergillus ibericus CBS 121593]RAL01038.1 asparagine synthase related protein [Aspergillus ibericus CBS 121593]
MCGIFFSLSASRAVLPNEETSRLLRQRGPDNYHVHNVERKVTNARSSNEEPIAIHLTFVSTVLSMRGDVLVPQPLVDPATQSVLCFNGDAWKIAGEPIQGNDAELIFKLLLQAVNPNSNTSLSADTCTNAVQGVLDVISSISGPFAFVFYDAVNSKLFFTRDSLGRRSLLQGVDEAGTLKICSLCDGTSSTHFSEVETDGVYMVDLENAIFQDDSASTSAGTPSFTPNCIQTLFWDQKRSDSSLLLKTPILPMNRSTPEGAPPSLNIETVAVKDLEQKLRQSLALRIQNVREPPTTSSGSNVKVAVLFSGGLDCTLLARLSHEILPESEVIDLLNVAFENPRVAAAAASKGETAVSVYENCPDRVTGRAAFAELQRVCPGRNWRFVAIDIPYVETVAHRDTVKRLMRPHNTEMDLSIACALYFASRGQGLAYDSRQGAQPAQYTTSARVLLSGLGADELFAGYSRHGIAFSRNGFAGLIDEINLDVSRLGKRNLGRDNRVIAHWGREARFPFLDEEFVSWVVQLPVWEKCGFGTPSPAEDSPEAGLESEKKALRLVALRLGMTNVAREKKRAIQFGSRTAKMEKSKVKGTDALT